ncbi:uncharacterized protein LOC143889250 isoform X2 [Tasmannia lanceolata]
MNAKIDEALEKIGRISFADNPQIQLYIDTITNEIIDYEHAFKLAKSGKQEGYSKDEIQEESLEWWEFLLYTYLSAQISMYKDALGLSIDGNLDNAVKGLNKALEMFKYYIGDAETNQRLDQIVDNLQILTYKKVALKLMLGGRIDEAVTLLKKVYELPNNTAEMKLELGTLLVEMLIYNGDYEEALKQESLQELREIGGGRPGVSGMDARHNLYQAASCTLLALEAEKKWSEALDWWKTFMTVERVMDIFAPQDPPVDATIREEFNQFKNDMNDLKQAIDAKKKR